jgi:hypothetical protein
VWPRWWSAEAEASPSARAELRFSVARRLGLDPRSLLEQEAEPRFLWHGDARFKHLRGEDELERAGITSFGRALTAVLVSATPGAPLDIAGQAPGAVRTEILASGRPYVDLVDLLSVCWGVGIPTAYLRVFPWPRKRMAAMVVGLADRASVLLAKDSNYPAQIAFYLAHELGHIALGHIAPDEVIVDLEEDEPGEERADDEETAADAFALELLMGEQRPRVLRDESGAPASAAGLAQAALERAPELHIEPGVLAMAYGHSTGAWAIANASLRSIYTDPKPVWREINSLALNQLELSDVPPDTRAFIQAVLGAPEE